jgi:hypothetical protein
MERILNTKYKIIFLNHESTKWIIPPNKGFYVPRGLLQYVQQRCPQNLEATLLQAKVFSQEKHGEAFEDYDDLESISSVSSSAVDGSKHSEITEEFFTFTIQLYYPPSLFEAFCIWVQTGCNIDEKNCGVGGIGRYIPRFVYPTVLEWYGAGPLISLYMKGPAPNHFNDNSLIAQINSLRNMIVRNINVLHSLKPDSSGNLRNISSGYLRSWQDLKNGLRIGTVLPHVSSYFEVFQEDIKGVLQKNPNYNGTLTVRTTSELHRISTLQFPQLLSEIESLHFETVHGVSRQFMTFYDQLYQVKILLLPHSSCPARAKEKLPNSIQLVLDTLILSKQITLDKAFEYCIDSFDAEDTFWNDIEEHIGKKLWDELQNFHEQSTQKNKKQKRNNVKEQHKQVKEEENVLKDFLNAFQKDFDAETREKILIRFEMAKKITFFSAKNE